MSQIRCGGPSAVRTRTAAKRALRAQISSDSSGGRYPLRTRPSISVACNIIPTWHCDEHRLRGVSLGHKRPLTPTEHEGRQYSKLVLQSRWKPDDSDGSGLVVLRWFSSSKRASTGVGNKFPPVSECFL